MSWTNKIVWSEGMFLQPQHFQQQERHIEKFVHDSVTSVASFLWGVRSLKLNPDLLGIGKFAVSHCRGIFEDGTPFSIPDDADHPPPLDVAEGSRNCIVYLALPFRQPGSVDVAFNGSAETAARYTEAEFEATDSNESAGSVTLNIGKLRLRYVLETSPRSGFACLGVARIVEVRPDKSIVLDNEYIPPALVCNASTVLSGFVTDILGRMRHRAEELAALVADPGSRGVSEVADFLLLQLINRYEPIFAHLSTCDTMHPERLYSTAVEIAGELATFTSQRRRPPQFPAYRHDDLRATFAPVVTEIRRALLAEPDRRAVPIPLEEKGYGIRVAIISDKNLLSNALLVFGVGSDLPDEELRRQLPRQVTVGSVEKIRDLVNSAAPGVRIQSLAAPPRQIPFRAGVTYFEMVRRGSHWDQLKQSGALAIHVAGDVRVTQMELWAIRGT